MRLSIVVCTYNRAELLACCLSSLAYQTVSHDSFEVIVIDNNSTDETESLCGKYREQIRNFKYVKEMQQGLGYARNRAIEEASCEWIAYVDDDAKAHSNYVERVLTVIDDYDFDCFGGVYNAWFTIERPKWIPKDFGTNKVKQNFTGILENDKFMDGGNMVWNKLALKSIGGFPVEIGMKGNQISFGEETYIQVLAREKGFLIGFDPELQIDHYVNPKKLTLCRFLEESYAAGRDFWLTFNVNPSNRDKSWINLLKIGYALLSGIFKNFKKLEQRDYYFNNFLIDTLNPVIFAWAKFKSSRQDKNKCVES